ncbi:helix-turn-helix domain-containing protein [Streptomyces buecherae]
MCHSSASPRELHSRYSDVNQLAQVLRQVMRLSHLSCDELTILLGGDVTLHQLTTVLTGDRLPDRQVIEGIARACDADLEVLLRIWEDECCRTQR